jgi:hypothetical protein
MPHLDQDVVEEHSDERVVFRDQYAQLVHLLVSLP